MDKWEAIKVTFLGFLGGFYVLLFILFVFKIWRGLTNPIDEIELIDTINKRNEEESLKEWSERESWEGPRAELTKVFTVNSAPPKGTLSFDYQFFSSKIKPCQIQTYFIS